MTKAAAREAGVNVLLHPQRQLQECILKFHQQLQQRLHGEVRLRPQPREALRTACAETITRYDGRTRHPPTTMKQRLSLPLQQVYMGGHYLATPGTKHNMSRNIW